MPKSSKKSSKKKQAHAPSTEHVFTTMPLPPETPGAPSKKEKPASPAKSNKAAALDTRQRTTLASKSRVAKKEDEGESTSSVSQEAIDHTARIERELTQIYENPDGTLPDMQSFQKGSRKKVARAVLFVLLSVSFLGGALWYGYMQFFQQSGTFVEQDVILSIGGEEQVGFGEEVRYRVRYKNAQAVSLETSVLEVRYPEGFVFVSASKEPDQDTNNTWTLGPLGRDDGEYIDIVGKLYGDVGAGQSFRVFLHYTPSNFSSTFQKVATQETTIAPIPYMLSMAGPDTVSQGGATDITIDITPRDEAVGVLPEHLALVFEPQDAFVTQRMTPESAFQNDRLWMIETLEDTTTFTITGAFAGAAGVLSPRAVLIGWREGQSQHEAYTLAEVTQEIAVAAQQLAVSLVANGSQQDITVQPGEAVQATVRIQNTSEETFENVRVRMLFDAPSSNNASIMSWADLVDAEDGAIVGEQLSPTLRRGQIAWTRQNIAALRSLAPGAEVTIDVTLPIQSGEDTDLSKYTGFVISLASDVQYTARGEEETATAVPLVLTLNSDTTFDVRDEVVGSEHTITWLLANSFHPLTDIEARVDLYGDISFDPENAAVPAGEIQYDAESQQLTWTVADMPVSVDVLALQFPVIVKQQNASQTQLTSKVTVTATDTVTGKQILLIGDQIGL